MLAVIHLYNPWRKHYKKTENQKLSPETAKEATRSGFIYDSDQQLEFPESPVPPIDNNKTLGHLSRADWPAGQAGNDDCLLDEDDEPQVDELDLEAEEEQ
ncbi:hypothetical protein M405DRAFT_71125 [Rhizopogon salebrosus TDB-379]|nr:hypothetical protein M405DRAFT_71125 [Rhizopogon salebrosus TDB-379]